MLSFNSALVLKPSDTDSLRLMITRGTQLPSLNTSGAFLVDTRYVKISGDPFINPMTVTNYELGWDHGLAGPHLPVRVSAFHQNNQDLPAIAGGSIPTASGTYLVGSNIGSSAANGPELGVKGTLPSHLRWSITYRPEKITDHFLPFAQNGAAYTEYQPPPQTSAQSQPGLGQRQLGVGRLSPISIHQPGPTAEAYRPRSDPHADPCLRVHRWPRRLQAQPADQLVYLRLEPHPR